MIHAFSLMLVALLTSSTGFTTTGPIHREQDQLRERVGTGQDITGYNISPERHRRVSRLHLGAFVA
jgi:hypothetical protein